MKAETKHKLIACLWILVLAPYLLIVAVITVVILISDLLGHAAMALRRLRPV